MNTLQALTLIKKRFFLLKAYTVAVLALAVLCVYWLFLFSQYADLHASLASGTLPVSAEPERLATALDVPYFGASRLFFAGFALITLLQAAWLCASLSLNKNLGVRGTSHTPAKAVIWHCLPVTNLVLPCLAWQEAWRVSQSPGQWRTVRRSALVFLWWALFLTALALFSLFVFRTLQLERASSMALFIQLPRFVWLGTGSTLLILLESLLALHLMRRMRTGWTLSAAKGDFPLYNGNG